MPELISPHPGHMEAKKYGLTRGACFVTRRCVSVSVTSSFEFSWSLLLCMLMPRHFGCVLSTLYVGISFGPRAAQHTQSSHHQLVNGTTRAGHATGLEFEPTASRLCMGGCCDAAVSKCVIILISIRFVWVLVQHIFSLLWMFVFCCADSKPQSKLTTD